jgi:hypothetical protein
VAFATIAAVALLDPFLHVLRWLVVPGLIPGIVLLVLGRGRGRTDQAIIGTTLVTLALVTPLLDMLGALPRWFVILLAVVGLLLLLVPVYRSPTRAVARGCVLCGTVL